MDFLASLIFLVLLALYIGSKMYYSKEIIHLTSFVSNHYSTFHSGLKYAYVYVNFQTTLWFRQNAQESTLCSLLRGAQLSVTSSFFTHLHTCSYSHIKCVTLLQTWLVLSLFIIFATITFFPLCHFPFSSLWHSSGKQL